MRTNFSKIIALTISFVASILVVNAQSAKQKTANISIETDKPTHQISPLLFGTFFEDINLSADGGLYPEMIRNRSFEDADTLQNWKFSSADKSIATLINTDIISIPNFSSLNPFNLKSLSVKTNSTFKLENRGYWGMNIEQGKTYKFKLAAKQTHTSAINLKVNLLNAKNEIIATGQIDKLLSKWEYYDLNFIALSSDTKAYLEIIGNGNGEVYLDMISLLPAETWKNHGLRTDLAKAMDDLKPKFFRFPGGCWVEGQDFKHMNQWKQTIGNLDTRTPLWNIWGYNATNSLGYHEYLQLAEDLGAEPLFCINAGISHADIVPMDQMGQWVQDALDAIEYANGPVTSVWGAIRAKNGHPKPFNMKYLEIGNENGQEPYAERWALFSQAIKEKYPDIILIANEWAGSHPTNPMPAVIDEHYYNNPDWFIWNANKYDSYDRKGSKIFVGEYAVTSNTGNGNLRGAIGEAAWMAGLERNSDVVIMAAYAPLYSNVQLKAWPVNLINFNSSSWYGLPSYYVQKMFATNQGTKNLPVTIKNAPVIEAPNANGGIGLGTWNNAAEFKDLKITAPDGKLMYQADFSKNIDSWRKNGKGVWTVENGVLKQSAIETNVTAFIGDNSWKDYTITLKARKITGENGFQIYFHNTNNGQRIRWDLGGYNNTIHLMEIGVISESMQATIEPMRWYDIKLEISGNSVKGYLDGKLIQEVKDDKANVSSLIASSAIDELTGDVIVKVINASQNAVNTKIDLLGNQSFTGKGVATILTSASGLDENTIEQPTKVAPKSESIKFSGKTINRTFPANSLTVFRLATNQQTK